MCTDGDVLCPRPKWPLWRCSPVSAWYLYWNVSSKTWPNSAYCCVGHPVGAYCSCHPWCFHSSLLTSSQGRGIGRAHVWNVIGHSERASLTSTVEWSAKMSLTATPLQ